MKFEVSLFILVMKMASDISKITLLQEIGILPRTTSCKVCSRQLGPYLTNSNYHYFECSTSKTKTAILNNKISSNSNTKLREFVVESSTTTFVGPTTTFVGPTTTASTWIPVTQLFTPTVSRGCGAILRGGLPNMIVQPWGIHTSLSMDREKESSKEKIHFGL